MNNGYCTNLPSACSKAASKEAIPMSALDSKCPECGSGLLVAKASSSKKSLWIVGAVLLALLLVGGVLLKNMFDPGGKDENSPPQPGVGTEKLLLRLSGSNTIGSALAPRLAEAWLTSMGATGVVSEQRDQNGHKIAESVIHGQLHGEAVTVEIRAHGSGDAFKHLADGSADIGMASRSVKPDEAQSLIALGDMSSRENEHVIALDGIAVIVAPGNGLSSLSRQTIGQIFAGELREWSQVSGRSGPIQLYARDDNSGTFDTFKSLVLHSGQLAAGARRFEDSAELEAAVAADPNGIGFVGLPYVKSARALPVSDGDALALAPTVFTVKKEDYALSRRLFLYTAANPSNDYVRQFTRFAQSEAGQQVVKSVGFVDQNLALSGDDRSQEQAARACILGSQWPKAKDAYCKLIAGKSDLGTNFRFRTGSAELDNRAAQDIQRLLKLMGENAERSLVLVGFADSQGQYGHNIGLSEERANAVRRALQTLGISGVETYGFGQELPVADNNTPDGRERNRRVEVWVK